MSQVHFDDDDHTTVTLFDNGTMTIAQAGHNYREQVTLDKDATTALRNRTNYNNTRARSESINIVFDGDQVRIHQQQYDQHSYVTIDEAMMNQVRPLRDEGAIVSDTTAADLLGEVR